MKTENPSACVTVYNRDSAVIAYSPELCKSISVNKCNHPIKTPSYMSRTTPKSDSMLFDSNREE
jgi:hypothetical protein